MLSFFKKGKDGDPPAAEAPAPAAEAPAEKAGWATRLRQGLARTREQLGRKVGALLNVHRRIDEDLYEELETILLTSDVGVEATQHLLDELRHRVKRDALDDAMQLKQALREVLTALLAPLEKPLEASGQRPFVIMLVGVNGAGKTTSIGKLARHFHSQGKSVLLAAGDTFRAAAREQLMAWGERNDVTVIAQEKGDSAAVI
ncbi:MAG TPA: signal recognition particle receptor subunit alpha, partial [Burkholderiales bacterium]